MSLLNNFPCENCNNGIDNYGFYSYNDICNNCKIEICNKCVIICSCKCVTICDICENYLCNECNKKCSIIVINKSLIYIIFYI